MTQAAVVRLSENRRRETCQRASAAGSASLTKGIFPLILSGCRSHAETLSDFRKNLLNIRKTVKDVGQNPVSLLMQHAGQPDCAA